MSPVPWLLAACLALPTVAWAAEPIRVALHEAAERVEVTGRHGLVVLDLGRRPLLAVPPGEPVRIAPWRRGLEVGSRRIELEAVRLEPRSGALGLGGREYPGAVEVVRQGAALLVVNELDLEAYVAGTLRGEVPETWPLETLKAQAVAARTYTVYHQRRNGSRSFHLLVGATASQEYHGRVPDGSPIWIAVRETRGAILTWRGEPFPSFYHAESGGWTEPPQAVFAGELPPLPGVRCEFSADSPHSAWTLALPLATLRDLLRKGGLELGEVTALEVIERSPSFRVVQLAVRGSRGAVVLAGTDFRRLLGPNVLKSTLFTVALNGRQVRFEGRGWGHGVGLSQYGAKGMAERGYSFREILEFYYPGTTLERRG
ncbi:MAG: SpoIID/LytB domain-containing protein [Candidatus Rokubacteria bacterium]|nr:SpoIID/LytB domain-containing protein [Candidatus Rokubacteria bacterium]